MENCKEQFKKAKKCIDDAKAKFFAFANEVVDEVIEKLNEEEEIACPSGVLYVDNDEIIAFFTEEDKLYFNTEDCGYACIYTLDTEDYINAIEYLAAWLDKN